MEERTTLKDQLGTVNQSISFLILIILSVLLSFWAVLIQRGQLICTLQGRTGEAAEAPPVFPIRLSASALIVASLGFFFCLALQTCRTAAQGDDPAAQRSAGINAWASLFVLAAALIRLYDLVTTQQQASLVEESVHPE